MSPLRSFGSVSKVDIYNLGRLYGMFQPYGTAVFAASAGADIGVEIDIAGDQAIVNMPVPAWMNDLPRIYVHLVNLAGAAEQNFTVAGLVRTNDAGLSVILGPTVFGTTDFAAIGHERIDISALANFAALAGPPNRPANLFLMVYYAAAGSGRNASDFLAMSCEVEII